MGQEELMFRCGGARKTYCGQVRERIVDFRDTTGKVEKTTVGHAVSRGIREKTCRYFGTQRILFQKDESSFPKR